MLVVVLIAVLTDICGNSIALEVALSDARALGANRAPMTAISVDLAIYGGPIERIVRERMWSRSRYATTTAGELRAAGHELVPAGRAPHFSVVLPDAGEATAASLLGHFGPTLVNEFKRPRR